MEDQRRHYIRVHEKAHRDLKIMSALTGRTMGDLIEEMIFRYKNELADGRDWDDNVRDLISEREEEIRDSFSAFEKRKEKAEYKLSMMRKIGNLRWWKKMPFAQIAKQLNDEGCQTLTGKGEWKAGSVYRLNQEQVKKLKKEKEMDQKIDQE